jgi:hypothetical protein
MSISEDRDCFAPKRFIARCERPHTGKTIGEATTFTATSVSNRNDAHAHRNRIFLRRRHQISIDETLQASTSPRESH